MIYTLAELIKELNFENKRKYSPLKVISCLKEREEVTSYGLRATGSVMRITPEFSSELPREIIKGIFIP